MNMFGNLPESNVVCRWAGVTLIVHPQQRARESAVLHTLQLLAWLGLIDESDVQFSLEVPWGGASATAHFRNSYQQLVVTDDTNNWRDGFVPSRYSLDVQVPISTTAESMANGAAAFLQKLGYQNTSVYLDSYVQGTYRLTVPSLFAGFEIAFISELEF